MSSYVYETHVFKHPLLPFIFHKAFTITNRSIPPNWHENLEILFCVSGSGKIQCGTACYDFSAGDLFVVNTDTPHVVFSAASVTYRCLIIDTGFLEANGFPVSGLQLQPLIKDPEAVRHFQSVYQAYEEYDSERLCAVADIRYAVLGLMRLLCGSYVTKLDPHRASGNWEHAKQALIYIRQNFYKPICLDDLSQHVGISKYHLSRIFRLYTGSTVVNTVNLIRCTEARQRIEAGTSVCAAAQSCGFENLSYFTRTFKSIFHACPSSFAPSRSSSQKQ